MTEEKKLYSHPELIESLRNCKNKEEVEQIFAHQNIAEDGIRAKLLQEAMGIESVRYFGGDVPDEKKYEAMVAEFEDKDWMFYQ